jgi:Rad3-related DNA helicase
MTPTDLQALREAAEKASKPGWVVPSFSRLANPKTILALLDALQRLEREKAAAIGLQQGTASLLASAEAALAEAGEVRKRLDRRIHNQRKAWRDNWEIIERRRTFGSKAYRFFCASIRRAREAVAATQAAEARVRELEAGLRPFATIADEYTDQEDDDFQVWKDFDVLGATLPLRIFRRARALLQPTEPSNGQ